MDEKEQFVRYAYIKNGDVVTQLQRILPITDTIPTSGPDAFLFDFLRSIGHQPILLLSCYTRKAKFWSGNMVVPTKQCGAIISISYILWLLLTHNEKSGVCKVIQGGILKSALLCRDYRRSESIIK